MKLGFVTAILPELSLDEVADFAISADYSCIEVMCWPKGKAERRYAGVTHIDVTDMTAEQAARVNEKMANKGVSISGLGYYPNPLAPDEDEATVAIEHLKKVIKASATLELYQVNTFIGRNWKLSVDENWPQFKKVWPDIIKFAEDHGVKIGIENCPMYFSNDEWPSGKNLAHTPAIWRRMFEEIPSQNFGLNFDPSHLVWQHMDYLKPLKEFAERIFHVHAKDARVDPDRLNDVGIMATPLEFHSPKLPGLGDVNWGQFFSVLYETGYNGPICVEVEDRAYEDSLAARKASVVQSARYLRQFITDY